MPLGRSACCSSKRRCPTQTRSRSARRMPTRDGNVLIPNPQYSIFSLAWCMCSHQPTIQVRATCQAASAFARGNAPVTSINAPSQPTIMCQVCSKRARKMLCGRTSAVLLEVGPTTLTLAHGLDSISLLLLNHRTCPQVFAATATDLADVIATATLASEDKAGTHAQPPASPPVLRTCSLTPITPRPPACRRRRSRR